MFLEKAAAALGTGSFPLLVHMSDKDIEMQTFGPVSLYAGGRADPVFLTLDTPSTPTRHRASRSRFPGSS